LLILRIGHVEFHKYNILDTIYCMSRKNSPISKTNIIRRNNPLKTFMKNFLYYKRAFLALSILACLLFATYYVPDAAAVSVTDNARRFTLENGFTVILKENHASPVVSIQVWVKTGSANETDKEAGITHLIEHMIFKGTPTKKTGQIARTIEASGGHINAYTSLDQTVYYVEIASSHFHTGLDVLLDAVQHSIFDPLELKREKEVVLEEYRRSLDIPDRRLAEYMMKLCYKKHPYRRPIIGYEETIRSFDRQAILDYMDKWYTPHNMVLVAVGDFDADQALKTIQGLVKTFPKRAGKNPARPMEPKQTSLRKLVRNEDIEQVYLDMSWHIPDLTHDHMPALDLIEIILGHGKSSRLYSRVKMQQSLVRNIDAGAYALADPGIFSIDATLSPENLKDVLEAIESEIDRITREPLSVSDLKKAKAIAEADFVFAMENMSGQARILAFFETMTGDMHNADKHLARLKRITASDIRHVAGTYFRPENLSIGILVPKEADIALSEQQITAIFSRAHIETSHKKADYQESDMNPSKITLGNGLRLLVKENHTLPVVSICAVFLGGVRLEEPQPCGISGFVSEMLTRGTSMRTAAQIASTVESWAGTLSGFSGRNSFGVSAEFLSKDLYPGLELLSDVLLNPAFPESEIEKVREDILADINAKKDNPTAQLFDLFNKTLFPNHPYGHPRTGTEKSILSIKRSDLINWYRSHGVPSNFVLAVVGDVNKDQLVPHIKTLFGKLVASVDTSPEIRPEPPLAESREAHLGSPRAQVHIAVGYLGASLESKNNAPMALLETSLSGQGGRLFFELRDKRSLAYSVTAFRRPGLETGTFGVYMACDPSKLATAKEGIFSQLEKVRKEGLSEKELEAAKRYLLGNLKIGLQTNGSQAMRMALDELYGLGYGYLKQYIRDIEAVTLNDIKRAAKEIILPEKFVLVTIGPESKR
jgi:zinc protease